MSLETTTVTLNNDITIPQLGLGVWQVPDDVAAEAVYQALRLGYRAIDTAKIYENERGVGEGLARFLADSDVDRSEVFITTKLWNTDQGYESTLEACQESLDRLGLDYLDLYLIHWPEPKNDRYLDTWRAFEELYRLKKTRAIGVSNFQPSHLQRILDLGGTVPAVNQIELHPKFPQTELRAFNAAHGIATESWSPLAQGTLMEHPVLVEIARQYQKTAAQVIIRWQLQLGNIVIPKSVKPERMAENAGVFDFALTAADMDTLTKLDSGERLGPDPDELHLS